MNHNQQKFSVKKTRIEGIRVNQVFWNICFIKKNARARAQHLYMYVLGHDNNKIEFWLGLWWKKKKQASKQTPQNEHVSLSFYVSV